MEIKDTTPSPDRLSWWFPSLLIVLKWHFISAPQRRTSQFNICSHPGCTVLLRPRTIDLGRTARGRRCSADRVRWGVLAYVHLTRIRLRAARNGECRVAGSVRSRNPERTAKRESGAPAQMATTLDKADGLRRVSSAWRRLNVPVELVYLTFFAAATRLAAITYPHAIVFD